jgi:cytoskeletal protein CcmA (bactofilin family)
VARVEGEVDGEIVANGTLIIGEGATVKATISGGSIVVHGNVTGDITARERLEIRAPSAIVGNITAPVLVIHEGASFEGKCSMRGGGRAESAKPKEQPAAPRPPVAASAS